MLRIKKIFASTAVFLAVSAAGIAPAHAALYAGTWDPDFGGSFTGLNWTGSILFDVPDACLTPGTATVACPGTLIESASVTFSGSYTETLNFSAADAAGSVNGVTFDANHQVSGLNTTTFGGELSSSTGKYFDLTFTGSTVYLSYRSSLLDSPVCGFVGDEGCGVSRTIPGAGMTVTAIPEPSTYAMLLAGLGAVGFVALRRRR